MDVIGRRHTVKSQSNKTKQNLWNGWNIVSFNILTYWFLAIHDQIKVFYSNKHNCDMIKWNESKVADIVFEILAKKQLKFLCFILFSGLINCS